MNKKEYSYFHYLLAKMKYDLVKQLQYEQLNKNMQERNKKIIKYIEEIEKIIIIGDVK